MDIRNGILARDSYLKDVEELIKHLKTLNFNIELINYFEPTYPQNVLEEECYIYVRMYNKKDKEKLKSIVSIIGGKVCDLSDNEAFWFSL